MLEPGVVVAGDYQVEGLLGDGGMGVVYEATQLSLDRKVALKLVAAELSADAAFRERFRREGRIQARIDHAHIIDVYGAGESPYGLFLAMRLVRGPSLKEMIAQARLETSRAVRFMTQIASALDAAHEVGLVHRDIKPHNILIDERREHSYLADFGVTKAQGRDTGLTRAGQLVGTLDYMAPEQFRGHEASELSDIYAFGVVLYESLAGTVPFVRPTEGAVMYAHLSDPVPSVQERRPGLPSEIDEVIGKAMAKRPEDRYSSAAGLMKEVTDILAAVRDQDVMSEPPPQPAPLDTSVGTRERSPETSVPPAQETELSTNGGARTPETAIPALDRDDDSPGRTVAPAPQPTAAAMAPATRLSETAQVRETEAGRTDSLDQLSETRMSPPAPAAVTDAGAVVPEADAGRVTVAEPSRVRRRARPASSRRAIVLAGGLATLAVAAAGFWIGHQSEDVSPTSAPTQRLLRGDGLSISVPAGWQATSQNPIDGLELENWVAASPSPAAGGGVLAGRTAPAWPSYLPADFRDRIGSSSLRRQEIVRLGDLNAFRYRHLNSRGFDGVVTVYAVPQPRDATIVACYARSRAAQALAKCDSIAASLKLAEAQSYALVPPPSYARAVNGAVNVLKSDRLRGLRAMRSASSRSAEARAAGTVATAYRRAVRRVRIASPTPFVRPAHARVSAALTRVANAYAALASAARAGNQRRYDLLRRLVRTRELQFARELARLRELGFRG